MALNFPKRLFPLHLSDIERFLLADDRPAYPMAFVIELAFSGIMDEAALRDSLVEALTRHPLLASKLGPAKNKPHCWLPPDGELPPLDVAELGTPLDCPGGEWIDIESHVGLRMWLRSGLDNEGQTRSILTCQFHHVCCDGIGGYRFLGDLLAYYAARTDGLGREAAIPPIDLGRLRGRADRCRLQTKGQASKEITRDSIRYITEIVGRGSTPLRFPKHKSGPLPASFPGVHSFLFSQTEAKQLRDVAKQMGLMLNDLLLLELFQTCHQWNCDQGGGGQRERYRVMMPVDLRTQEDYETPAANVVGYTFLTRTARELADRTALATSIREETAGIKHNRSGERFVEMVATGATVRGLLPLMTKLPRTLCTVILSNIGDPSRRFLAKFERRGGSLVAGNLLLESITGYPPMRPRSRASISVVQYRRELMIGVRCDPHRFSSSDTARMLDIYISKLQAYLPTPTAERPSVVRSPTRDARCRCVAAIEDNAAAGRADIRPASSGLPVGGRRRPL